MKEKPLINEVKRMQQLAGIVNESQSNETKPDFIISQFGNEEKFDYGSATA